MNYKYSSEDLRGVLFARVIENTPHAHYDRTTERAAFYRQIMTGESQDKLIVSYKPRETAEQKKQRISLTNSRTKFVASKIVKVFAEVERSTPVIDQIEYKTESDSDEQKLSEIEERLAVFNGDRNAKKYLHEAVRHLNFYDPNAFLVIEFQPFENQKPQTYPVEVYSEQVYDYEYVNGTLEYLTIRHKVQKTDSKGKLVICDKFTMYAPDIAYVLTELAKGDAAENEAVTLTFGKQKKQYDLETFQTLSKICPAIQVGYCRDPFTNRETFLSPLDEAEHVFLDLINTKSEYDLARALHGFIQKFAYADVCDYKAPSNEYADACRGGTLMSGGKCPNCNGRGLVLHTSVQDIVLKKMPQDKEEHIPLDQMVHYVEIPSSIIDRWKQDMVDLERNVIEAVFNKDTFAQTEVVGTAYEKNLDKQNVYNVLSEYGGRWSEIYSFVVRLTAIHTQNDEGLKVQHKFSDDFSLETLTELLALRGLALKNAAPFSVLQNIDRKIRNKQSGGNNDAVMMQDAIERHRPFRTKTADERLMIIAELPAKNQNKVLWMYFDEIISEVVRENIDPFWRIDFSEQQKLILEKVKEYTPQTANFGSIGDE